MIKIESTTRSLIIATIALALVAGVAYWFYADSKRQALAKQQVEEGQRAAEQQQKLEREKSETEARQRKATELEELKGWAARLTEESKSKRRADEANQLTKARQDRTERSKQRSEDAKRTLASLTLVSETVQTIRPFAFVGTRAQENATEILRFVGNACNKIQTAQSAPCIDSLKSAAGSYCQAVTQVSQQSIIDPGFFSNDDARLRLHNWIRDNGYQYDAAFDNCRTFLDKERAALTQDNDELNKSSNAAR